LITTDRAAGKEQPTFLQRNLRTILAVAVFGLFIHDIFGSHGFLAMRRTQRQIGQFREEILQLNSENQSLNDQVNALKTDPKLIERIARDDMGLARPGEYIFKFPTPQDANAPGAPTKSR
jgi:cell division protein FtsB